MEALKSVQSLQNLQKTERVRQSENIKTYTKESFKEEIQNSQLQKVQINETDLKDIVKALNKMPIFKDSLSFGFSEDIGELLVQIKDKKTDKLIRQYPTEEFISNILYYRETIGLLLDKIV